MSLQSFSWSCSFALPPGIRRQIAEVDGENGVKFKYNPCVGVPTSVVPNRSLAFEARPQLVLTKKGAHKLALSFPFLAATFSAPQSLQLSNSLLLRLYSLSKVSS